MHILESLFAPHEEFNHTVCEYGSTKYEKTDYFYKHWSILKTNYDILQCKSTFLKIRKWKCSLTLVDFLLG